MINLCFAHHRVLKFILRVCRVIGLHQTAMRVSFSKLFPILIFAILSFAAFTDPTCPSPTYELPIRNVSLTEKISRRGIFISIGTPSPGQSFAFQLSW